jgi:hypothetical protein
MNRENDAEFWKRQYEVIRKEREDSFAMLSKTVGKIGCTASQPEVDLEIDARIKQLIQERQDLRGLLMEMEEMCHYICGQHPETPIRGKIESMAFELGHHLLQFQHIYRET